jgi:hypothetical protein
LICSFDDIVHRFFHWSLGHWSLDHWSLGHLVTWSLATWSLDDKPFWACTLQQWKISFQSPQGTADHLVTGHLVTWSLATWSLATWSLDDKPFWACTLQQWKISFQSPQGTADHLVTWSLGHLITWSLSHLMINLYERAHNYAKFLYNHHRVQLVSWSLVTWSLVTWSLSHLVINLPEGAHNNYAKFHYIRISSLWTHRRQTNKQTNKQTNILVFFIYIEDDSTKVIQSLQFFLSAKNFEKLKLRFVLIRNSTKFFFSYHVKFYKVNHIHIRCSKSHKKYLKYGNRPTT